uniref:Sjoegren syndrome/scleroderma autoantigen 1 n=2 Tax=Auxenochlorella protothecoides TaxID=3075 RepID=A0A1D2A727_AUXPR
MGQPAMDVSSPTDRSNTSASMGSLLLQGWAMLADGCEHCGTPLMRKPNSEDTVCVTCEARPAQAAPAPGPGLQAEISEDLSSPGSVLQGPTLAQRIQRAAEDEREQEISQSLADRMLHGWTLLGQSCPICSTVLVRSRERQVFCVSCKMPVRLGSEAQPTQSGPAARPPAAAEQIGEASTTSDQSGSGALPPLGSPEAAAAARDDQAAPAHASLPDTGSQLEAGVIIADAKAAVLRQMAQATHLLSGEDRVEAQLHIIQAAAQALTALRGC